MSYCDRLHASYLHASHLYNGILCTIRIFLSGNYSVRHSIVPICSYIMATKNRIVPVVIQMCRASRPPNWVNSDPVPGSKIVYGRELKT